MKSEANGQDAQATAVAALSFIAGDPVLLPRFLALTGIEAGAIRQAAREPGFLAGVLQFILGHEATLMDFADSTGRDPASVAAALRALPNGDGSYMASI